MFYLLNLIFLIVAIVLDNVLGIAPNPSPLGPIYFLYAIATFLPGAAITVRRLHDAGKSGWYFFITVIPLVGAILLIVALCTDGIPGQNKYGLNPKEATTS